MRGDGYRLARDAQDRRYESAVGLPVEDRDRQEYRDYFGVGDCSGQVESRVTFKGWLLENRAEVEPAGQALGLISAESAFWLTGADLASLAADGCSNAAAEIARRAAKRAARRVAA